MPTRKSESGTIKETRPRYILLFFLVLCVNMKTNSVFRVIKRSLNNAPPFSLSYGPGGRSSNSGLTATVFGATGFVGKYFVDELGWILQSILFLFYCVNLTIAFIFDKAPVGLEYMFPTEDAKWKFATSKSCSTMDRQDYN
jgi:hypothetical protein